MPNLQITSKAAKRSRGSSFAPEIAEEILERIAKGESLRSICQREDMPCFGLVSEWSAGTKPAPIERFGERYARARELGYDAMAESIVSIADSATGEDAQARRLQVDARRWLLSKMMPKRYGDRLELAGDPSAPLTVSHTVRRLADAFSAEELERMEQRMIEGE